MNDLAAVVRVSERYSLGEILGRAAAVVMVGARDRVLDREVVLHTVDDGVIASPEARDQFCTTARQLAKLRHPGILPVYDLGTLPDGRPFMTTAPELGAGLDEAVEGLHEGRGSAVQLVSAVRDAARALAHAHALGVLHGDLDPESIRLGSDGVVVLADWGVGGPRAGHPAYWAPEVAHAAGHHASQPSDIYALGAALYLVLTGAAPYEGSAEAVPEAVRTSAPPDAAERVAHVPRPGALLDVCRTAMAREPSERFGSAQALADALTGWIERRAQRDRARARVAEADALVPKLTSLRAWAGEREQLGAAVLDQASPVGPLADKEPGWALLEEGEALRHEAQLVEATIEQRLCAAVAADPALPEAHEMMASLWRSRHAAAEASGQREALVIAEAHLRAHTQALPPLSQSKGALLQYLEGHGALTLHCSPRAQVSIQRLEAHQRRLVAGPEQALGSTPLVGSPIPMGTYLLHLRAEGCASVTVPVRVSRGEHVVVRPPGVAEPAVVALPPACEIGEHEVVVSAGWFEAGGDPEALNGLPAQRVWVDGFVIRERPVTHREFLAFVEQVRCTEGLSAALRHAPKDPGPTGENRRVVYDQESDGRLCLGSTSEGDPIQPDWPVTFVTCHAARAYAAWVAEQSGLSWRLPSELEWEKAARGADARVYPWGNHHDPGFAIGLAGRDPVLPASVDSAPIDVSPYGVRGLGGNAQDWCIDRFEELGPAVVDGRARITPAPEHDDAWHVIRGGGFAVDSVWARCASRGRRQAITRGRSLGFRLARSLS